MTDYYISRDQECIVVEIESSRVPGTNLGIAIREFRHRLGATLTPTEWEAFVNEGNAIRDAIESGADDPDALGDLIWDAR